MKRDEQNERDREERRQERLARKRAVFKQLAKEVVGSTSWALDNSVETKDMGQLHPSAAAMLFVREALAEYQIPDLKLRYAGMKRWGTGEPGDTRIKDGVITIQAEICSQSGVRQYCDIPVVVHGGRMVTPEILLHNGEPRVLAQSTFDDLIHRGDVHKAAPERKNMFVPPHEQDRAGSDLKTQLSNQGDWTQVTRKAQLEHEGLDPAERDRSQYLSPGQAVSAAHEISLTNRGGGHTTIPAGSSGKIIRDMFGDDTCYYVEFDKFGKAPVNRGDLK